LVPYHIWQTCDEELEGQEGESEEKRKEKVDRGKSDFRLPFPSSPELLRALSEHMRADHTRGEGGDEYTRAHD
jgi:hypothetical protein